MSNQELFAEWWSSEGYKYYPMDRDACVAAWKAASSTKIDVLLEALKIARESLRACYDSSEDNRDNPMMQKIGKAIKKSDASIAKAESEGL
jgi:hypothetical protein